MELDPCFSSLLVSVSPGSLYRHKAQPLVCGTATITFSSSVVFRINFSAKSKTLPLVRGRLFLLLLFPFLILKEAEGSKMPFQNHLPKLAYISQKTTPTCQGSLCAEFPFT